MDVPPSSTGAGAGIGAACARELAQRGATVVCSDIDGTSAPGVAAGIVADGGKATAATVDVRDPDALAALVGRIVEDSGRLDIAVNNAGISAEQLPVADLTPALWRKTLDINLDGVFFSMLAEIPAMVAAGGGSIINMGSILSSIAWPNAAAYTTSKHAVLGLTRSAALDYAASGVRVNAVGPGFVSTDLVRNALTPEVFDTLVDAPDRPHGYHLRTSPSWWPSSPATTPPTSRAPTWSRTAASPSSRGPICMSRETSRHDPCRQGQPAQRGLVVLVLQPSGEVHVQEPSGLESVISQPARVLSWWWRVQRAPRLSGLVVPPSFQASA